MSSQRTRAILEVLRRGREPKLAPSILKIFGASSFEEACATYEVVGNAERASLDAAVERMAADASAAFWLSVENQKT